jgi:hypothetical protein
MLDRSVGSEDVRRILSEQTERLIVQPLMAQLSGPDPRVRAMLAVTIIMGGGPIRRALGVEDLRAADPETLTHRIAAMFETALAPLR